MVPLDKEELRRTARAVRDGLTEERREEAAEGVARQLLELPEMQAARRVLVYATLPGELDPLRWCGTKGPALCGGAKGVARVRERAPFTPLPPELVWPRVAGDELTLHACAADELVPGSFGLREPPADAPMVALSAIDVALVPGLAFDARGYRVGYGKGYYDRLLADAPATLLTIGLCFAETYYPEIAHDNFDIPVTRVIVA